MPRERPKKMAKRQKKKKRKEKKERKKEKEGRKTDCKPNVTKKSPSEINVKINQGHSGHDGLRLRKNLLIWVSLDSLRKNRNKICMVLVTIPTWGEKKSNR